MNVTWKNLENKLKEYVSLDHYLPVEKIAYGIAGIILTGAIVALMSLIIK